MTKMNLLYDQTIIHRHTGIGLHLLLFLFDLCSSNNILSSQPPSHTHPKAIFSSYLVVVKVTIDGKSVSSDSPLVARRPPPAPSQHASITFGSKKLRRDITLFWQTEDERNMTTIQRQVKDVVFFYYACTFCFIFLCMSVCCAVARLVLWRCDLYLRWSLVLTLLAIEKRNIKTHKHKH